MKRWYNGESYDVESQRKRDALSSMSSTERYRFNRSKKKRKDSLTDRASGNSGPNTWEGIEKISINQSLSAIDPRAAKSIEETIKKDVEFIGNERKSDHIYTREFAQQQLESKDPLNAKRKEITASLYHSKAGRTKNGLLPIEANPEPWHLNPACFVSSDKMRSLENCTNYTTVEALLFQPLLSIKKGKPLPESDLTSTLLGKACNLHRVFRCIERNFNSSLFELRLKLMHETPRWLIRTQLDSEENKPAALFAIDFTIDPEMRFIMRFLYVGFFEKGREDNSNASFPSSSSSSSGERSQPPSNAITNKDAACNGEASGKCEKTLSFQLLEEIQKRLLARQLEPMNAWSRIQYVNMDASGKELIAKLPLSFVAYYYMSPIANRDSLADHIHQRDIMRSESEV